MADLVALPGVGWHRNRDRHMTCRSCRANATRILTLDGRIQSSTCERHLALNLRRTNEAALACVSRS